MVFVQHSQRMVNVFHVRAGSAPTLANCQAVRALFVTWDASGLSGQPSLKSYRANNASLVLIRVESLHAVGAPFEEYTLPSASVGGLTPIYPSYVSWAVKWNTALAGRNYRGRTYHVAPAVGIDATGLVSVANTATLQTIYAGLLAGITAAGFTLVVASKYDGVEFVNGYRRGIPRAEGITTPITGANVERGLDTLRKRKIPHIA